MALAPFGPTDAVCGRDVFPDRARIYGAMPASDRYDYRDARKHAIVATML